MASQQQQQQQTQKQYSPRSSFFSPKFTVHEAAKIQTQRLLTIQDLHDVSPLTTLPTETDPSSTLSPSANNSNNNSFNESRRPSYASQVTNSSIGSAGNSSIYSTSPTHNTSSQPAASTSTLEIDPAAGDARTSRANSRINPVVFPQPDDVFDTKLLRYSNASESLPSQTPSIKSVRAESIDSSSSTLAKKSKKSFLGKLISRRESSTDFNEKKRHKNKNNDGGPRSNSIIPQTFKYDLHSPVLHRGSAASTFMSHMSFDFDPHGKKSSLSRQTSASDLLFKAKQAPNHQNSIYALDTDLEHMTGIVDGTKRSHSASNSVSASNTLKLNNVENIPDPATSSSTDRAPGWEAPESWAIMPDTATSIKRSSTGHTSSSLSSALSPVSPTIFKTPMTPTTPSRKKSNVKHCVRIFRENGTFGTISCDLSTTVTELIQLLGRKFFLPSVAGYQLTVWVGGLRKILLPKERPLLYQRQLLEYMGYTEEDKLGDIGREDLSYLCRFEFGTLSMRNFTDEERAKLSRDFSHADMQKMDLQTIPVLFYSHCAEIEHLDVSENPSITIPSDFVQACINLKSIRYVRNRAIQFPLNVLHTVHLNQLDLSQNLISHLENVDFSRLSSLVTLDLHGNKLSSIHESISKLKSLENLNLSSNDLTEVATALCEIITLNHLDLSFNRLESLPDEIGNLINLNSLAVNNNYLSKRLPSTFPNLVSLQDLDLRYNRLQDIDILSLLPNLEVLYCSKNTVSSFKAEFFKLKLFYFDRNPITKIELVPTLTSLTVLNLSKAKIVALQETFLEKIPFVEKLVLDKNHLSSLPPHIGSLKYLIYLSVVANNLDSVPPEIELLQELRHLDLHNNNIRSLPEEIWNLAYLEVLNVSSNLLETFPKRIVHSSISSSDDEKSTFFGDNIEQENGRRPSTLSISSSLGPSDRRMSVIPNNNKYSFPRENRKRSRQTLANCLITLSLSDNRLTDECFEDISWLTELQVLNLSYNELVDIPYGALRQLHHLTELYLSGNQLTSLPAEDLERIQTLRILHVNCNKLHTLPAELGKIKNLTCLDIGSNNLKYNINNWPYDWNWNYNLGLKYLNFSGNRRLEIKAQHPQSSHFREKDLSDFTALTDIKVLGLMDVTLITPSIPDQTKDCRIRTFGSEINSMPYGLADSIGQADNVIAMDMVLERFRGKDNEVVIGLFDGRGDDGNLVSKLIQESFGNVFTAELGRTENIPDALRLAFLNTNKEIGNSLLGKSGVTGSCATIVYIANNKMYVANAGDSMAIISRASGEHSVLTTRHDPTSQEELARIRSGGGVVSSIGKLDDILDVSRSMGYYDLIPHIHATPSITEYDLSDNDEILIIGSKQLWEYVSYQIALDVVRMSEGDMMRAAAKLRDFAIAYGASDKIMVMVLGVGMSRRKSKTRIINFGPMATSIGEEELFPAFKKKRDKNLLPEDSGLARLGDEVDPPINELALVFTDIKNSTFLWETSPTAMRSAIKIHNSIMRRQLRIIGGYEVKTEGDAFMVSFPTPTSALLWCLSVQSLLLVADWPAEILDGTEGCEVMDEHDELIFRGLSVRMGIHWGSPVCERDPITRRMDYFGPMVNRASRVSAVADGGQIALSFGFMSEMKKLEVSMKSFKDGQVVSLSDAFGGDETLGLAIDHDLKMLNSQGWVCKDFGEVKLKGLENSEHITLAYQKSLLGRYKIHQERLALKNQQPAHKSKISQDYIDLLLHLRMIAIRLEKVCAFMSYSAPPIDFSEQVQKLSATSSLGFHPTNDIDYAIFLGGLITRIENCLAMLYLRTTVNKVVNSQELALALSNGKDINGLDGILEVFLSLKSLLP